MTDSSLQGKRIAILLAFRDFKDEEYFIAKDILESAGAEVVTASDSVGVAIGSEGGEAGVQELIERLRVEDYDAIVFVGGGGMAKKIDDPDLQKLARQTVQNDKVLAAICVAPAILAKAGVLKGKKATVWSGIMDRSAIKILTAAGAIYENKPVVVDGKIITANGPSAAEEFAKKLIETIGNISR